MGRRRHAMAAAAAVALAAPTTVATAYEGGPKDGGITTVAGGLDGPRQLDDHRHGLVVAEADTGEISSVDRKTGNVETLLTITGIPQGLDSDDGLLFVAV